MSMFMIVFHYNGKWINSEYIGGQTKTMVIPNSITYAELVKRLYHRIDISPENFGMKLHHQYNNNLEVCNMMEIVVNEDVASWVFESLFIHPNKIPLYIIVEHNLSMYASGSCEETTNKPNASLQYEDFVSTIPSSGLLEGQQPNTYSSFYESDNMQNTLEHQFNLDVNESSRDDSYNNNVDVDNEQPTVNSTPSSSRSRKRMSIQDYDNIISVDNTGDIMVGQLYTSKKDLKQHLSMVAIRKNYEFKVIKSDSGQFEVGCVDEDCKWRLRATKLQDLTYFEVRKFYNEHSCSLDAIHRDHRQASSTLIGQFVKSKFQGGTSWIYRPRDIIDDARMHLGVNMGYNKAWRAREAALEVVRGSPEKSFAILLAYCAMLERTNHGTITHIETDGENHFMYFFMAIGASLRDFHDSMRPVVAIDGTFLKGKYFGTMFVAACQDGENQIYPLAFGVADSENDASWSWFLTKLKVAIGVVENMVFISDRHGSIAKAVDNIFPEAHHGACIFHIANNLKFKFGKPKKIFKLYYTTAKKYQVSEFNTVMEDLRKLKDGEVYKYLEDIGYHKWARAYFMGYRYNMMTSNIAESMNAKLKEAQKLPITALVDHLREVLQQWFVERRTVASSLNTHLTKLAEDKVRQNNNSGLHMRVAPIDYCAFQIHDQDKTFTVDLNNKTCTCREFDLDRLLCTHATAACRAKGISVYSMCSQFYTANALVLAYADPIWPVGNRSEWDVPENVQNRVVLPPARQVIPGR